MSLCQIYDGKDAIVAYNLSIDLFIEKNLIRCVSVVTNRRSYSLNNILEKMQFDYDGEE